MVGIALKTAVQEEELENVLATQLASQTKQET